MISDKTKRLAAAKKLFAPGAQKPVYLLNFVTNRCAAACEHCFYWEKINTDKKHELTVEEHSKIAASLGPMFQVTFTGGSPELRSDLNEIVYEYYRYCRPSNMTFCMLGYDTEGIRGHIKKILTQCRGQQVTVGLSLDAVGGEHDRYRKLKGLFERVMATIDELNILKRSHNNLRIAVGTVVHGLNIETVEETSLWIRNNLKVDILKPILVRGNPLNPGAKSDECAEVYSRITEADRKWLLEMSESENSFKDKIIAAKEDVQRKVISEISKTGKQIIKCSGGLETAVMYPAGEIAGCEMRDEILGNIKEHNYNFSSVWFSENAKRFRATSGKMPECRGCYHHCFISPAIFRSPSYWPSVAKSVLSINNKSK